MRTELGPPLFFSVRTPFCSFLHSTEIILCKVSAVKEFFKKILEKLRTIVDNCISLSTKRKF